MSAVAFRLSAQADEAVKRLMAAQQPLGLDVDTLKALLGVVSVRLGQAIGEEALAEELLRIRGIVLGQDDLG